MNHKFLNLIQKFVLIVTLFFHKCFVNSPFFLIFSSTDQDFRLARFSGFAKICAKGQVLRSFSRFFLHINISSAKEGERKIERER